MSATAPDLSSRPFSALIPNPFGDWAKVWFENFYLWKMRTGRSFLP